MTTLALAVPEISLGPKI